MSLDCATFLTVDGWHETVPVVSSDPVKKREQQISMHEDAGLMKKPAFVHSAYSRVGQTLHNARLPGSIQRSLELVRTCHQDLQYLIDLRDENLEFLQTQPKILHRLNLVIAAAHHGLVDACRIVEKFRPEPRGGKTSFHSRVEWVFADSSEFRSQEPVISRHHASVLTELNFLRQLVLLPVVQAGLGNGKQPSLTKADAKTIADFENMALLGDLMGDITGTNQFELAYNILSFLKRVHTSLTYRAAVSTTKTTAGPKFRNLSQPAMQSPKQVNVTVFSDLPEPVIPGALPQPVNKVVGRISEVPTHHLRTRRSTLPTTKKEVQHEKSFVINSIDKDNLSLMLGDEFDTVLSLSSPNASPQALLQNSQSIQSTCATFNASRVHFPANLAISHDGSRISTLVRTNMPDSVCDDRLPSVVCPLGSQITGSQAGNLPAGGSVILECPKDASCKPHHEQPQHPTLSSKSLASSISSSTWNSSSSSPQSRIQPNAQPVSAYSTPFSANGPCSAPLLVPLPTSWLYRSDTPASARNDFSKTAGPGGQI